MIEQITAEVIEKARQAGATHRCARTGKFYRQRYKNQPIYQAEFDETGELTEWQQQWGRSYLPMSVVPL